VCEVWTSVHVCAVFTAPIFTELVITQEGQQSFSVEKPVLSMSEERKASQMECDEYIGDLLCCEAIVRQEFLSPGRTIN